MSRGLNGWSLGAANAPHGALVQVFSAVSEAGTSSYTLCSKTYHKMRVISVWGYMTGAGDSSDTVQITTGGNAITDAVDVSAKGDKDYFTVGEIDDTYNEIAKGEDISMTTASDALCRMFVMCEVIE